MLTVGKKKVRDIRKEITPMFDNRDISILKRELEIKYEGREVEMVKKFMNDMNELKTHYEEQIKFYKNLVENKINESESVAGILLELKEKEEKLRKEEEKNFLKLDNQQKILVSKIKVNADNIKASKKKDDGKRPPRWQ